MTAVQAAAAAKPSLRCSFCGRHEDDVRKVIAGAAAVYICDICVGDCVAILDDDQAANRFSEPDLAQTQTLLNLLEGEAGKGDDMREALQGIVDALRRRKVSWAVIGATLGVSRQAAWDRFSKPGA